MNILACDKLVILVCGREPPLRMVEPILLELRVGSHYN